MPYIHERDRGRAQFVPHTPGELNFAVTCIIRQYAYRSGLSYSVINDVLGALEGAKLEFFRRVVVPYEEIKRAEHGDVYYGTE